MVRLSPGALEGDMETIAVTMQKGGAGKTTTAWNLSAYLARLGKRVLIIDLDPQASLTLVAGLRDAAAQGPTAFELLMDPAVRVSNVVRKTSIPGLEVVPAHEGLSGAELLLTTQIARETRLEAKVKAIPPGSYDYVFIDTRPSLGLLTINAIVASTGVLIPLRADYLTFAKLPELCQTLDLIETNLQHPIKIWGVLLLAYNEDKLEARLLKPEIEKYFAAAEASELLFKTVIRESAMIGRSHMEHKDIEAVASKSIAAQDYRALAQEVLNRGSQVAAA
jgi:chromosome partitioning protein